MRGGREPRGRVSRVAVQQARDDATAGRDFGRCCVCCGGRSCVRSCVQSAVSGAWLLGCRAAMLQGCWPRRRPARRRAHSRERRSSCGQGPANHGRAGTKTASIHCTAATAAAASLPAAAASLPAAARLHGHTHRDSHTPLHHRNHVVSPRPSPAAPRHARARR